ncbi:hypothetical protein K2173_014336 [Erythroxylum novogranatense]|uniref:Uncharacterized protein n=1 Tax=Erythroxylum novogranatense TaxID=1862640 RepID=A0AAV8S604_9ROSI|nr:hypothetical protein K2173_014336 [Erythroxylum novogranatense]
MTMQPQNLRKRRLKSHEKDLQRNSQFGKAPPTGSVLAFQILSPILTHQGQCRTVTSKILTLLLILLGGLSCFLFNGFFHAFMSLLVFAVALFDSNVNKCFWPTPSEELKDILALHSVLIFPSKRHGIGSPLSRN